MRCCVTTITSAASSVRADLVPLRRRTQANLTPRAPRIFFVHAETFDGAVGVATGPESATGKFQTKLSASGLVYKHYGKDILCALHPSLKASPSDLEWVYVKLYADFMEGIDANDNGIEIAGSNPVLYKENTTLPHRVARLNARWNEPPGGPTEDGPAPATTSF